MLFSVLRRLNAMYLFFRRLPKAGLVRGSPSPAVGSRRKNMEKYYLSAEPAGTSHRHAFSKSKRASAEPRKSLVIELCSRLGSTLQERGRQTRTSFNKSQYGSILVELLRARHHLRVPGLSCPGAITRQGFHKRKRPCSESRSLEGS